MSVHDGHRQRGRTVSRAPRRGGYRAVRPISVRAGTVVTFSDRQERGRLRSSEPSSPPLRRDGYMVTWQSRKCPWPRRSCPSAVLCSITST